jgi:hypothetical protein
MFRGFEKYQDLPQNLKGLAFDFIEKRLFMAENPYFIPLRPIFGII